MVAVTGPVTPLRPADVLIVGFDSHGPLAMDITVRDLLRSSQPVRVISMPDWHHAQELEKCAKYVVHTNRAKWQFKPFVLDVWGGMGEDAQSVVNHLIKGMVSQRDAWQRREVESTVWQTLTFTLMREIGKQLAMEMPGKVQPGAKRARLAQPC